ncbi:MAG: hypothetical protein NVS3B10_31410 [Polyangiales bacterium]
MVGTFAGSFACGGRTDAAPVDAGPPGRCMSYGWSRTADAGPTEVISCAAGRTCSLVNTASPNCSDPAPDPPNCGRIHCDRAVHCECRDADAGDCACNPGI